VMFRKGYRYFLVRAEGTFALHALR
jgi:hypothetical protein